MKNGLKLVLKSFFLKIETKPEKRPRQFCREFSGLQDRMKFFWKMFPLSFWNWKRKWKICPDSLLENFLGYKTSKSVQKRKNSAILDFWKFGLKKIDSLKSLAANSTNKVYKIYTLTPETRKFSGEKAKAKRKRRAGESGMK